MPVVTHKSTVHVVTLGIMRHFDFPVLHLLSIGDFSYSSLLSGPNELSPRPNTSL